MRGRPRPGSVAATPQRMTLHRPLSAQRVLVTRPEHQADDLVEALEGLGAAVTAIPTIRLDDPPDPGPLAAAAARVHTYDRVVLTSANGVRRLAAAVERVHGSLEPFRRARFAVIGPATGDVVRSFGGEVGWLPDSYRAEGLADALLDRTDGVAGARILLARAEEARDVLPDTLREAGAEVEVVPAYVTRVAHERAPELRRLLGRDELDWITFTASSTVRSWVEMVGAGTGSARVAAIGPITAGTARELAVRVDAVAERYTIDGLVEALVQAVTERPVAGGA